MKIFRFIILTLLLVPLTCSNLFNDANIPFWGSGGCISYIPSSWAFVDGGDADGITKVAGNAASPQLAHFNGRLYAAWNEDNGTADQIRVAVYNENNTWAFVDGGGDNGINKATHFSAENPQLAVFNGRLYATWKENNKIRVAVYNGIDTWSFVDGNGADGINYYSGENASSPQIAVFIGKLYATWHEVNAIPANQIRVAIYNEDNTWRFVDGNGTNGLNYIASESAAVPQLTVHGRDLYITWQESGNIRVKASRR